MASTRLTESNTYKKFMAELTDPDGKTEECEWYALGLLQRAIIRRDDLSDLQQLHWAYLSAYSEWVVAKAYRRINRALVAEFILSKTARDAMSARVNELDAKISATVADPQWDASAGNYRTIGRDDTAEQVYWGVSELRKAEFHVPPWPVADTLSYNGELVAAASNSTEVKALELVVGVLCAYYQERTGWTPYTDTDGLYAEVHGEVAARFHGSSPAERLHAHLSAL
ncbi:MAG: hypothetical protein SFU83_14985 [Meiothermus sp.]|nr:hypothetical protein [Meiothermus sp.]